MTGCAALRKDTYYVNFKAVIARCDYRLFLTEYTILLMNNTVMPYVSNMFFHIDIRIFSNAGRFICDRMPIVSILTSKNRASSGSSSISGYASPFFQRLMAWYVCNPEKRSKCLLGDVFCIPESFQIFSNVKFHFITSFICFRTGSVAFIISSAALIFNKREHVFFQSLI